MAKDPPKYIENSKRLMEEFIGYLFSVYEVKDYLKYMILKPHNEECKQMRILLITDKPLLNYNEIDINSSDYTGLSVISHDGLWVDFSGFEVKDLIPMPNDITQKLNYTLHDVYSKWGVLYGKGAQKTEAKEEEPHKPELNEYIITCMKKYAIDRKIKDEIITADQMISNLVTLLLLKNFTNKECYYIVEKLDKNLIYELTKLLNLWINQNPVDI